MILMSRDHPDEPRRTRVLIVDDHPAVREALTVRISTQSDLEVCGEAVDVNEALLVAQATRPDVAVIDTCLKTGDGLDLIRRMRAQQPGIRMLVWSMYSDNLYAERALRAGALGYLNKEHATSTIIEAIRRVLDGKVYLSPAMTEKLLQRTVGQADADQGRRQVATLSDRELAVFRLIGEGMKTQDIAEKLNLSPKTIDTYRDRIREKLGLRGSTELVRTAVRWVIDRL
jgi:DNA-binding NarL/FixJ family response regulator